MGDDEQAGTAIRTGHGFRHPHDRGEPCLLHIYPAHSLDHHQPDKPALCRGPARQGDQSREQVARSFGISASCLARWLRIADREDTLANASDASDDRALQVENRELRKRTKQLEQENEILRRATAYFARETLPT